MPDHSPETTARRTALATVCLSGTLADKLQAAAGAGFDGVEIFEPDLIAAPSSPEEIRSRCADLGVSIDLYQPFRDFDSTDPGALERNLQRARHKFDVMRKLGTDLVLVCSNVSSDAVPDDDRLAEQLHRLADAAADAGVRICYEALAWGREVNTYDHSWRIVQEADHPALGLCLDSFHILSRGSDPAGIADIPGEKLFFLQLADAPHQDMNVLQWSRHYRLFPGQGAFDLPTFLGYVLAAGYDGPLSLEVFNDVFRQADPTRTAVDAHRSLLALQEATTGLLPVAAGSAVTVPPRPELHGLAFVELVVDPDAADHIGGTLTGLGFRSAGRHRSKPVTLWAQGDSRILLNVAEAEHVDTAAVAALGIDTLSPADATARAQALQAPVLPRRRGPAEADIHAVAAPDGVQVFFCGPDDSAGWRADFSIDPAGKTSATWISHTDHVALTQPFDRFDEATLFYRSILGLHPQHSSEIAAPFGLVRNRAVADGDRTVRICLSVSVLRRGADWHPGVTDPQHVAFATSDALALARAARAAGVRLLPIPDNYYDDLDARLDVEPEVLQQMRELGVMLDRDPDGEFRHFYTEVFGGRIFFEVVQRIGDYQGYGESNGPIRMASHRRQRIAPG